MQRLGVVLLPGFSVPQSLQVAETPAAYHMTPGQGVEIISPPCFIPFKRGIVIQADGNRERTGFPATLRKSPFFDPGSSAV